MSAVGLRSIVYTSNANTVITQRARSTDKYVASMVSRCMASAWRRVRPLIPWSDRCPKFPQRQRCQILDRLIGMEHRRAFPFLALPSA